MTTDDVVLATLTEKIQLQERLIAELQGELKRLHGASVSEMLGPLRLREAVLLYVGRDSEKLLRDLEAEGCDREAVRAVAQHLFVLDYAPVTAEVREAFRKAAKGGTYRWFPSTERLEARANEPGPQK